MNKTWLILGIIGILMLLPKKKKKASQTPSDLRGFTRSCDLWFKTTDKNGKTIHRCFIYAPSCSPKKCVTDFKLDGILATCKKYKKRTNGTTYCAKYAPTCNTTDKGCRKKPAEIPGKTQKKSKKQIQKEKEKEVMAIAKALSDEANDTLDHNKQLMRKILSYGGIAPHKSGFLREEYNELPDKYKRKNGIPLDELAQELGTDGRTLTDDIYSAEESFRKLKDMRQGKTARRFKKDDFINEAWDRMAKGLGLSGLKESWKKAAYDNAAPIWRDSRKTKKYDSMTKAYLNQKAEMEKIERKLKERKKRKIQKEIIEQTDFLAPSQMTLFGYRKKIHGDDFFSPKQKELFPELRRELILEADDTATSNDPLEACLERKGWDLRKVQKLQDSIAEKMTIDMFGKQKKLTGNEVMLQENIQKCLERLK